MFERVPQHVADIMDGNGRWAKQRGHELQLRTSRSVPETRPCNSRRGSQTGHQISDPIYVLNRKLEPPTDEVAALMSLLFDSIEEDTFMKNNISFRIIGDIEKLPANVQTRLYNCVENTSKNTGMCLVLALSYSSRWEITEASRQIAALVQKGELTPEQIDCDLMSKHLTTHFMPDPDLLIRTGGEIRLSNYLLWQCAYSELYFCETYWPDFREEELCKAICDYQRRERRFGKTSEQIS